MNNDNPLSVNNDWRWNTKNDFGYAIYNIMRQWVRLETVAAICISDLTLFIPADG